MLCGVFCPSINIGRFDWHFHKLRPIAPDYSTAARASSSFSRLAGEALEKICCARGGVAHPLLHNKFFRAPCRKDQCTEAFEGVSQGSVHRSFRSECRALSERLQGLVLQEKNVVQERVLHTPSKFLLCRREALHILENFCCAGGKHCTSSKKFVVQEAVLHAASCTANFFERSFAPRVGGHMLLQKNKALRYAVL